MMSMDRVKPTAANQRTSSAGFRDGEGVALLGVKLYKKKRGQLEADLDAKSQTVRE